MNKLFSYLILYKKEVILSLLMKLLMMIFEVIFIFCFIPLVNNRSILVSKIFNISLNRDTAIWMILLSGFLYVSFHYLYETKLFKLTRKSSLDFKFTLLDLLEQFRYKNLTLGIQSKVHHFITNESRYIGRGAASLILMTIDFTYLLFATVFLLKYSLNIFLLSLFISAFFFYLYQQINKRNKKDTATFFYQKQKVNIYTDIIVKRILSLSFLKGRTKFISNLKSLLEDVVENDMKIMIRGHRVSFLYEMFSILFIFIFFKLTYSKSFSLGYSLFFLLVIYRMTPKILSILRGYLDINNALEAIQSFEEIRASINKNLIQSDTSNNTAINKLSLKFNELKIYPTLNFKNIDLNFEKGKIYALIGSTGAGKSTLLSIISGIIDTSKDTYYINDKAVDKFNESQLKKIQFLDSNPFIIEGSVFDNLNISNNIEIERAEKVLISLMPNLKLDQEATTLSLGQRQIISFVRSLCSNPQLFILDESLSNIDLSLEKNIFKIIKNELKDCITIIITHRLHSIKDFNQIYILKNGEQINIDKNNTSIDKILDTLES